MWRMSSGSSSVLPIHGVMPSRTPKRKLLASAPRWSWMKSAMRAGRFAQQAAQQGVHPQPFAQAQVLGAVVVVAGDDAGAEQPDGGNRRVEQRRRHRKRRHLVLSAVVVEQRRAAFVRPDEAKRGGGEHGEAQIAQNGDAL